MNKLIPDLRFTGFTDDLKEVLLKEVSQISTGKSNREDSKETGKYRFFDRSTDVRMSDFYLFDCKAIIVPGEGSSFKPNYYNGKFGLHQRVYSIMKKQNIKMNWKFLYYFLDQNRNEFLKGSVGSTVRSLRMNSFTEIKIKSPSIEEQNRIASFLTAIDRQCEIGEIKIKCVKDWKKGLLQRMFV